MQAEYIERGETIYFTPETDTNAGDIVVIGGKRVAIAATNILAGTGGVAHTVGVFAMPKGAEAIAQGAEVYWDGTACATAGDTLAGYAFADATEKDETVAVKLQG